MRHAGLLILFVLAACQQAGAPAAEAAPPLTLTPSAAVNPDPGVRTYRCEDGRTVQAGYPDRDTAVVDVDGRAHPLRAGPAASGVRYVGFGLQWWTKGMDEGRLARLKPGETIASDPGVLCRVSPAASGQPGPQR